MIAKRKNLIFYANNISLNIADSKAFTDMINAPHSGYDPHNRKTLAGQICYETNKINLFNDGKKSKNCNHHTHAKQLVKHKC